MQNHRINNLKLKNKLNILTKAETITTIVVQIYYKLWGILYRGTISKKENKKGSIRKYVLHAITFAPA